ncbi:MAG: FG-GAP-like repeat-containing protein [Thermoanaerobaculia bacterium]
MRHTLKALVRFSVIGLVLMPWTALAAAAKPTGESAPGEVIVKFRPGTPASAVAAAHQGADIDKDDKLAEVTSGTIRRFRSRSKNTEALVRALEHNPNVVYVEPNYIIRRNAVPADTKYSELWALRNTGQLVGYYETGIAGIDINAEAAWDVTTGSAGIVVGVVDTGVDYTHPDLAANIWSNPGGVGDPNCAAGTHGFDAITRTCDPKPFDSFHGTHVAGTIGAVGNNALGVTGVNWTTTIMPLKFMNADGGWIADAIAAIDFAIQAKIEGVNVRVLNNSWGGEAFSKALLDEILKANEHDILFVASAGNDSINIESWPTYPAGYASPNVITVAATDYRDRLAAFSNYGPNTVHLGAPGANIVSTYSYGGYTSLSGTSMAAPHVSGVAALLLSKSPTLTTAEVKQAILSGVDPIPALAGKTITGGRLNAAKVLGVPAGADFSLSTNPAVATVIAGQSVSVEIAIAPTGGFSEPVQLSASSLPPYVTASFTPNPATTSSTLTLTASASAGYYAGSSATAMIGAGSSQAGHTVLLPVTVVKSPPVTVCPKFIRYYSPSWYGEATGIALGDFDRNGTMDIASVSANSATTLILLGRNDGGFSIGSNLVGGSAPVAVATADFNRDGKLDLAIANAGGSQVSVHLGLGNGSFSAAMQFQSGSNPFAIATGDFDADGQVDLAVANNGSSSVSILRGLGDGSFAAPVSVAVASGPHWLAAGDFNHDGRTDLAVAAFNANQLVVLLGNGNGTFQPGVSYPAGTRTSSVALGDVDGDGILDLAATGNGSNDVSVLTGNGDGTFRPAVAYPVGKGPSSVAIVDVDDDGHPDLAVSSEDDSTVTVLLGQADGSFGSQSVWETGWLPSQLVAADVDRNGSADLIVAPAGATSLTILRNLGACKMNCGSLESGAMYAVGSIPDGIATGDFNADGATDVVTANRGSNNVSIAFGRGDGTLQPPTSYAAGTVPRSVQVADLDGDGASDLAVANQTSNDVSILLGNADGSFDPAVAYATGSAPRSSAIGDFNRDGRLDVAVANSGSDDISILLGSGSGSFGAATSVACGDSPRSVIAADFDRDGILDLAVANFGSNDITLLRGNGDATFLPGSTVATGTAPVALIAADVNRDGVLDLATANSGSGDVAILLGNIAGTFAGATFVATGTNPSSLVATDVNDDGIPDLAVVGADSEDVTILRGNGDGTFVASVVGPLVHPVGITAADLDGDGRDELAVSSETSNAVSVLINNCPAPDLVVTSSHADPFRQGDIGKPFTLTVSNAGGSASFGLVGISDALPRGLWATSIAGTGWDCALNTLTCLRSDSLGAGASYPPITLTVSVASAAPATLTNGATVTGGGEIDKTNDSTADVVTVTQDPDLVIEITRPNPFAQGETGQKYSIDVRNAGGAATSGAVTVTDALSTGLTATAIGGSGWNCNLGALSCSRSDALGSGASYPPISLTVNVAASAPVEVLNLASVSGGGELNLANSSAANRTAVWSSTACHQYGSGVAFLLGGGSTGTIAVGDFNGDTIPDIVGTPSYEGLAVLIGRGTGDFEPAVKSFDAVSFNSLTAVDLNRDSVLDLLALSFSSDSLSELIGAGDGSFVLRGTQAISDPQRMAIGDFNGDGFPDVAVIPGSGAKLSLFIGTGDGSMFAPFDVETLVNPSDIVSGDFDGDRIIDLAVSSALGDTLQLLRGIGDGTFHAPVVYSVGARPQRLAVSDLDDDGDLDLVASCSTSNYYESLVSVMLGRGDGTLTPATLWPAPSYSPFQVVIEDMNSDGDADIVLKSGYLQGNGDGSFLPYTTLPNSYGSGGLVVADLDRDGSQDIVMGSDGYAYTYLGSCIDLAVTKSHTGSLHGGQTGATYTIVARNAGTRPSRGAVTVTDVLPDALTATAMSGSGWTCDVASTTCTRGDILAPGAQFPSITLTVDVSNTTSWSVTNVAKLSGGGDANSTNNSWSDYTGILRHQDLVVSMSYFPTLSAGSTNVTFYAEVRNAGDEPTSGSVTFSLSVAPGLTLTGLSGTGWSCNTASATCTRSDSLGGSTYYPSLSAAVSVAENCPSPATSVATVSGGGDTSPDNNTDSMTSVVLTRPANFIARASGPNSALLTWSAIPNASGYEIARSTANGSFATLARVNSTSYTNYNLASTELYRYRVRAYHLDYSSTGPFSVIDSVLSSLSFTDDPVVAGTTVTRGVHLVELRNAVGRMRNAAGLASVTWTDPTLVGVPIKAIHITELRARLNEACSALGMPTQTFTDPTLTPGTPMKGVHIQELRDAVK